MAVKEIHSEEMMDKTNAYINAQVRSKEAFYDKPSFFGNKDHIAKYKEVKAIVANFFNVHNGIYVTHRANKKDPFTAVKVSSPNFPNSLPSSLKHAMFYKPLEDLGVEIVFAKGTNSWIFRVR